MQKTLKIIFFSSLLGVILAGVFFFTIKEKAEAKNKPILYAYQVGVFKSFENATNYKTRFPLGIIIHDKEYYRIYIGVTRKNKTLLSSIFDEANISYYVKELEIKDQTAEKIAKYDELLAKSQKENHLYIIKNMLESVQDEL